MLTIEIDNEAPAVFKGLNSLKPARITFEIEWEEK
jgi:hypothetical protein